MTNKGEDASARLIVVDASAKLPAGILGGTLAAMGDYDACMALTFMNRFNDEVEDFRGQYCSVRITPPLPPKPRHISKGVVIVNTEQFPEHHVLRQFAISVHNFYFTHVRLGLCFPSTCPAEDVQKLLYVAKSLLNLNASVIHCEVRPDAYNMSGEQLVALVVVLCFVLVVFIATSMDILNRTYKSCKSKVLTHAYSVEAFMDMSVIRSSAKLLQVRTPADEHSRNLQAIHGIRAFNVFWIIVAHTYAFGEITTYRNGLSVLEQASNLLFQPVLNSFLCVDTFFFLGGFLITFNQCKIFYKTHPVLDYFGKLVARYWRLVPVAAACTCFIFLAPELGSGPIWHEKMGQATENCRRTWWAILLVIHNFEGYEQSCLPHYWYISADIQMYAVILATSILLGRQPKLALLITACLLTLSAIVVGILTYINNYPPTLLMLSRDYHYSKDLLSEIYFRPYVHIGPYLTGSLVAYLYLHHRNTHVPRILEGLLWITCIAAGSYVNFITVVWSNGDLPSSFWSSVYAGTHRIVWSACVGWVVHRCAVGRGGLLNRLLSWKFLVPVSRVSFAIYVIHIYTIYFKLWTTRERISLSHFHVFMTAISNFVVSCILGFLVAIIFEKPVVYVWDTLSTGACFSKKAKNEKNGVQDSKPVHAGVCKQVSIGRDLSANMHCTGTRVEGV
ncbi:nose resistant to fluoxetine protein 6-like isoform X2 [Ornithodoros turicata]|uniref:nose resistant to fluoxetine protein 6-like isoform X2 n=1 Tax=Ornithodoros turicata TaxID=34597 RepID=UPI003139B75D